MNELCTWSRERLARYLDGELSAQERARLDEHLAACAECRASLEALRAGDELARDASGATSADDEQSFDAWLQAFTSRHDLESAARLRSEEMASDEAAGRAGRGFLSAEEIAARPLEPALKRGKRRAPHTAWRWARIALPAAAAAVVVVVLLVREPGLSEKAMAPMVSDRHLASEPTGTMASTQPATEVKPGGAAEAAPQRGASNMADRAVEPARMSAPEIMPETASQPAPAPATERAAAPAPAPVSEPVSSLEQKDEREEQAAPPAERSRTMESRDTKVAEGLKELPAPDLGTPLRVGDSARDAIQSLATKAAGAAPSAAPVAAALPHTRGGRGQRVMFYLHGQIVEDQGRLAVSDRYGPYEYDAILGALRAGDYTVISEVRPKDTDPLAYARKVVGQIDSLKAAGVPSDHITVVGASKGGLIAVYIANLLRDEAVSYVLLAICGEGTLGLWAARDICPVGRVLSIYDATDQYAATCDPLFNRCASLVAEKREIKLDLGLGHGLVYKPLKEWVEPTLAWGRR